MARTQRLALAAILLLAAPTLSPLHAQDTPGETMRSLATEAKGLAERYRTRMDGNPARREALEEQLGALYRDAEAAADTLDARKARFLCARALAGGLQETEVVDQRIHWLRAAHDAARWNDEVGNWIHNAQELSVLLARYDSLEAAEAVAVESAARLEPDNAARIRLFTQIANIATFRHDWSASLRILDLAEAHLPDLQGGNWDIVRGEIAGLRGQAFLDMGLPDQATIAVEQERSCYLNYLAARPKIRKTVRAQVHANLAVRRANLRLATERWDAAIREIDEARRENDGFADYPTGALLLRVREAYAYFNKAFLDDAYLPRAEEIERQLLEADQSSSLPPQERRNVQTNLLHMLIRSERIAEARELLASIEESGEERDVSTFERARLTALEARLAERSRADRSTILDIHGRLERLCNELLAERDDIDLRSGGVGFLYEANTRFVLGALASLTIQLSGREIGGRIELDRLLRIQGLSTLARSLGSPEATLARVRGELLAEDELMIVYLPAKDVSHVFAFDRTRFEVEQIAERPLIEHERRELVDLVTRRPADLTPDERSERQIRLDAAGRRLGAILFPDSIASLIASSSRVTIVGADLLGYLPFECLIPPGGELLGFDKAFGYLPSAPLGLSLLDRRSQRTSETAAPPAVDCVFVTSVRPGTDLPATAAALPLLPLEAPARQRLTGAYDSTRIRMLSGDDATWENLQALDSRSVRSLHFLVHGVHDYSRERSAGLLLTPGADGGTGLVFSDLLDTLQPPSLVLMTACGTGRGPARFGDSGISNLGGTMLKAGAETVVLPYAQLAYGPTIELSSLFHAALRSGESPAESMRRARVQMATDDRFIDPYYHSLLHVRGLSHHTLFPRATTAEADSFEESRRRLPWWAAVVGALGILVVFWFIRRRS